MSCVDNDTSLPGSAFTYKMRGAIPPMMCYMHMCFRKFLGPGSYFTHSDDPTQ